MRSERYTRVLIVAAIVLLALPVSAADGPERDRAVPTEAALWEAAGKAYGSQGAVHARRMLLRRR